MQSSESGVQLPEKHLQREKEIKMGDVKTRDPQKDLYHTDYKNWLIKVDDWLGDNAAEPDYPSHLAPWLTALITALETALDDWDNKNEDQSGKNKVYTTKAKEVRENLIKLKMSLPTVMPDPPVLSEFGLARNIPRDRDEIQQMAVGVVNEWNTVSDPAVPPEYAPLEADFVAFLALYQAFIDARDDYNNRYNEAQVAQNAVLDARAACHDVERKIFNWYRARHQDSTDEWWTGTWWGATYGKDGIPAPMMLTYDVGSGTLSWSPVDNADSYIVDIRPVGASGDWDHLWEGIETETTAQPSVPGEYNARVRAVIDSVLGKFSGAITVNF